MTKSQNKENVQSRMKGEGRHDPEARKGKAGATQDLKLTLCIPGRGYQDHLRVWSGTWSPDLPKQGPGGTTLQCKGRSREPPRSS
jgi:hypothetical protein